MSRSNSGLVVIGSMKNVVLSLATDNGKHAGKVTQCPLSIQVQYFMDEKTDALRSRKKAIKLRAR